MKTKKNKEILSFLSDLHRVMSDYDERTIIETKNFISEYYNNEHRLLVSELISALLNLKYFFKNLNFHQKITIDNSYITSTAKNVTTTTTTLPEHESDYSDRFLIKEVSSILEDPEFIKSKKEAILFSRKFFSNNISLRNNKKESKNDIIKKILSEYKRINKDDKIRLYKIFRREYLKSRKSDLKSWSDIISNGD